MMDCVVRIYRVPLSAAVRVRNVIIQYYTVVRNGENPYPVAGGKGGGIPYIGGTGRHTLIGRKVRRRNCHRQQ